MPTRPSQLLLLFFLLLSLATCSYLEMQLIRSPQQSESVSLSPVQCNRLSVNNEADFKELCYEKDITYSIPFIIEGTHYSLAADFTTPISWIKGKSCKIQSTGKRCQRLT